MKRYEWDCERSRMQESGDGPFVSFTDHEQAMRELRGEYELKLAEMQRQRDFARKEWDEADAEVAKLEASLAEMERVREENEANFAERLKARLKADSKGQPETWGFVSMFMQMIDETQKDTELSIEAVREELKRRGIDMAKAHERVAQALRERDKK